jgi:hypothetical protein
VWLVAEGAAQVPFLSEPVLAGRTELPKNDGRRAGAREGDAGHPGAAALAAIVSAMVGPTDEN